MASNRWLMLTILFLVRTAMGFQFQTVGSLGPALIDAFAIGYASFGALIGLYLLPGVVMALPGGLMSDRFGGRQVAVAGLGLMALGGVIMTMSGTFAELIVGRVLGGTGAILMNVVVTRMVTDWFAGREIRTAMATLVASWPLGIALGLVLFAPLAARFGWPAVMLAAAIGCLIMAALMLAFYRDPPALPAPRPSRFALDLTGREWRLILIAGSIWGVYNVGYVVLVSFLPGLFAHQGYGPAEATTVASMLGWSLIVLVPAGGYLADRYGRGDALMLVGLIATALGAVLIPLPSVTMAAYALVLIAAGLPAGAIMALPATAVRGELRGPGTGIYFAWSYALITVLPPAAGLARDLTHSAAAPMWFAAAMLLVAAGGLATFRMFFRSPGQ